jgi:4-alpha-glucanotransferase
MTLLKQLADLVGFHSAYTNSFGEYVEASDEARSKLLQAMGYNTDEQSLQQHIQQLTEAKWRQLTAETHIIATENNQPVISISVPESSHQIIQWQIITEQGEVLTDSTPLEQLTCIAEATLADNNFHQYRLPLPMLAEGYHQLQLIVGEQSQTSHLIYAPKRCYLPSQIAPHKMWGLAIQLYSVHSETSWGIGSFGDLTTLVKQAGKNQLDAIGLNPLHPLYLSNPAHRSPYSPTSRCFLNTLYIDVTQVPNFNECTKAQQIVSSEQFQQQLAQAQQSTLVDYPLVAQLKYPVLKCLYQHFVQQYEALASEWHQQFEQFKQTSGKSLYLLATFEALYQHFLAQDATAYGWHKWPAEYQQCDSDAVKHFQQQHHDTIDYFMFLQWLAHQQLMLAATEAKTSGLSVGLYLDLAVGCDGSGFDVWSNPQVYVAGASVGAPPDALNTIGQDWGLTPMNPITLKQQGYEPLIKAIRNNMQYAGALRIDHILGLMRQYWVAPGMKADQGVYISFPLDDILRIIALESQRAKCCVIGEDLGTVPEGFSDIMQAAGLLSYKVLYFERWQSGLFKRPECYPELSMVTVSTHDLPTLAGWWTGNDLKWRQQLNLYPNEAMGETERANRIIDREQLLAALLDQDVISPDELPPQAPAQINRALTLAVQRFLAKAPSAIQLIPAEDALECIEQVNIPGTVDEHPNWRRKLPVSIDEFWQQASVQQMVTTLQQARPRNKS